MSIFRQFFAGIAAFCYIFMVMRWSISPFVLWKSEIKITNNHNVTEYRETLPYWLLAKTFLALWQSSPQTEYVIIIIQIFSSESGVFPIDTTCIPSACEMLAQLLCVRSNWKNKHFNLKKSRRAHSSIKPPRYKHEFNMNWIIDYMLPKKKTYFSCLGFVEKWNKLKIGT